MQDSVSKYGHAWECGGGGGQRVREATDSLQTELGMQCLPSRMQLHIRKDTWIKTNSCDSAGLNIL